jgi:hypothetical protein
MLKSLDLVIGATTVLLLFSMAVTAVTQIVSEALERRGKHLQMGLTDLLQQLGISDRGHAAYIAEQLLLHPLVAGPGRKLGNVIFREEFTKLLLDFAGNQGIRNLKSDARDALSLMLQANGVNNAQETLKNITSMALEIEQANPELTSDVRDRIAILSAAANDFVGRVNSWFDQTIDRVSQRFTSYTHGITLLVALVLAFGLQLNIVTVVNRLSADDQFRQAAASVAVKVTSTPPPGNTAAADYYRFLDNAGLVTLPVWNSPVNWTKVPQIFLTAMLMTLGAPFWYNALKDLLRLRSAMAQKDEQQRTQQQTASVDSRGNTVVASETGSITPAWLRGERGDLSPVG